MAAGGGRGGSRMHPLTRQSVKIISGNYKGYVGIVREATNDIARVELHAKNKIISINTKDLRAAGD